MHWNYRILLHPDDYYAVHEVFYNEDNKPDGWTEDPIDFGGDNPEDVRQALRTALSDITKLPVLRITKKDKLKEMK